jgi:hypothetical protein
VAYQIKQITRKMKATEHAPDSAITASLQSEAIATNPRVPSSVSLPNSRKLNTILDSFMPSESVSVEEFQFSDSDIQPIFGRMTKCLII